MSTALVMTPTPGADRSTTSTVPKKRYWSIQMVGASFFLARLNSTPSTPNFTSS